MKKIDFTFIKNRFFLGGLLSGVFISALAFVLIISSYNPSLEKNKLKGAMMGSSWSPSVGQTGIIQSSGNLCGYTYCYVKFDNDPNNESKLCHTEIVSIPTVEIQAIANGEFCQGGGIFVVAVPVQN
ncbi:MAG: hypothetical protein PHF97_12140 [Bacteroidales bacterium]|nr:hypothetical protein [Bacteroidales bacterium]MDD4604537.1 hypothetical protein [Bacteroidales bacterium]